MIHNFDKSIPSLDGGSGFSVAVLMSTYNGSKYIKEQIDSILNQVSVNVHLIIRDDNSSDNTVKIIQKLNNKNITLISGEENIGPCKSFLSLMRMKHKASYTALADQDDLWDNDKLISAIRMIQQYTQNVPILYHSNLRVVDADKSYLRNAHARPQVSKHKYSFLAEGLAVGCTVVYNKALAEIINRMQIKNFSMHDTCAYCIASLFGKVVYDFTPHISYRQHGSNTIGTSKKRFSMDTIRIERKKFFSNKEPRFSNAIELYSCLHDVLSKEDKEKINKILQYKNNFYSTLKLLLDEDIKPSTLYRRIRFDLMILRRMI